MRRACWPLFALMLAACGGGAEENASDAGGEAPETVATPAPPREVPMPTAPGALPAPELAGVTTSGGEWRVERDAAHFTASDGRSLTIACDREARRMRFRVVGIDTGGMLRLVTPSAATTLSAGGDGASLPATDSFLGNLGRAGETIGVGATDAVALVAPPETRLAGLIERCRRP